MKFMEKNLAVTLPSCSMMTQGLLIDMYKALRRSTMDYLKDTSCTFLLFDGWTDKYRKMSYMGAKCAIIDSS